MGGPGKSPERMAWAGEQENGTMVRTCKGVGGCWAWKIL